MLFYNCDKRYIFFFLYFNIKIFYADTYGYRYCDICERIKYSIKLLCGEFFCKDCFTKFLYAKLKEKELERECPCNNKLLKCKNKIIKINEKTFELANDFYRFEENGTKMLDLYYKVTGKNLKTFFCFRKQKQNIVKMQ